MAALMAKFLISLALLSGAPVHAHATAYCQTGLMADGSDVRSGSAASNVLRLGTRVQLVGQSFFGRRRFTIRDRGGLLGDGRLDLWTSSCRTALDWGYRFVTYRIGWR